jgi:hypothetical protein
MELTTRLLAEPGGTVRALLFDPAGARLAALGAALRVWSGDPLAELTGLPAPAAGSEHIGARFHPAAIAASMSIEVLAERNRNPSRACMSLP